MAASDQVDRDHVGHERDVRVLLGGGLERLLDGVAGGVGDMDDAPVAVPALTGEVQRAAVLRERHTELDQMGDRARSRLDDMLDDLDIVEPRSGDHRIVDVSVEAVAFLEHRGDAALSPAGRALAERAFGDDRDLVRLGKVERSRQPCRTGADDQHVRADAHAASWSGAVRLRNTSSRSGSRVDTSTIERPSAVSPASTWPAFVRSLR